MIIYWNTVQTVWINSVRISEGFDKGRAVPGMSGIAFVQAQGSLNLFEDNYCFLSFVKFYFYVFLDFRTSQFN